jgi:hypothetical protein
LSGEGSVPNSTWCGTYRDMFSPDDKNPESLRFVDEVEGGGLVISANTGSVKWGPRFDPKTSVRCEIQGPPPLFPFLFVLITNAYKS